MINLYDSSVCLSYNANWSVSFAKMNYISTERSWLKMILIKTDTRVSLFITCNNENANIAFGFQLIDCISTKNRRMGRRERTLDKLIQNRTKWRCKSTKHCQDSNKLETTQISWHMYNEAFKHVLPKQLHCHVCPSFSSSLRRERERDRVKRA